MTKEERDRLPTPPEPYDLTPCDWCPDLAGATGLESITCFCYNSGVGHVCFPPRREPPPDNPLCIVMEGAEL